MEKALVVYKSKNGRTKKMSWEISSLLENNGIEPILISIEEFKPEHLNDATYLFLGCWTSGLFFFKQHPEKEWVEFAKSLPSIENKTKICLFTTYKIATGSMFKNMKKYLKYNLDKVLYEIKSKDGYLSEGDQNLVMNFVKS